MDQEPEFSKYEPVDDLKTILRFLSEIITEEMVEGRDDVEDSITRITEYFSRPKHGVHFRVDDGTLEAVPFHPFECDECNLQMKAMAKTTMSAMNIGARQVMDEEW